jgi:hypothetical protein
VDRQVEPLVMDSEISGLENRHAFLKLGNNVARFHFEYMDLPLTTPGFIPRRDDEDQLPFDPKTLAPRKSESQAPEIDLEADTLTAAVLPRQRPEEDDAEVEQLQIEEPAEEELVLVPTASFVTADTTEADGDQAPQSSFPFQQ